MGYMSLVSHFNNSIVDYVYNPILCSWNQSRALIGIFKASVKFWGNSEGGNSGERLVWSLARLSDFYSVPYLKKVKFWINSGESQGNLKISYLKPLEEQGSSGESQGNLKISYLNPMKMQGSSGETQGKLKNPNKSY